MKEEKFISWEDLEKEIENMPPDTKWQKFKRLFNQYGPLNPKNMIWWVRHRITDRYHFVKPRTLMPGYIDPMEMMLHVNFELLTAFVEGEMYDVDWTWSEEHQHAASEIENLYKWWKKHKEPKPKDYNWDNYDFIEEDEIEQRNLERLIKVRGFLWT